MTITAGTYGFDLRIPVGNAIDLTRATSLALVITGSAGTRRLICTAPNESMCDASGNVIMLADGVTPEWPAGTWVLHSVVQGDFPAAFPGIYSGQLEYEDADRQLVSGPITITVSPRVGA